MSTRNPVFTRAEGFNGKQSANAYGNQTFPGNGQTHAGYGMNPSSYGDPTAPVQQGTGRMTIDSVVQKTGMTLGVLLVAAAATWLLTGDPVANDDTARTLYVLAMIGAFGGFALSLVNSFKKVISPGLVLAYAALEGVFVGAMSKVFQVTFGDGVVTGAVVGTIAAFAGTLAAYKVFNIKVGNKFRMIVTAAMFGFVGLALLDMVLGFFHASFGFNGFGTLGLLASVAGLVIGVLMLVMDFDFVERGIAAGLPERESWRAAFGLTVTIIWIYIQLLRILAILSRR